MGTSSLRRKVIVLFFSFNLIFVCISIFSLYYVQNKIVQSEIDLEFVNIKALVNEKIYSDALELRLIGDKLKSNEEFINLFEEQNYRKLEKYLFSFNKDISNTDEKIQFRFISNNNVFFYRSYSQLKGDMMKNSYMLDKVIDLGTSVFYIENGTFANLSVRTLMPVYNNNYIRIGYIGVSKPLTTIFDEINELSHMEYVFLAKKSLVNKRIWEKNNTSYINEWDNFTNTIFYWSSLKDLDNKFFEDLKSIENKSNIKELDVLKTNYLVNEIPILNFDDSELGTLYSMHNNSLHLKNLQKIITYLVISSLLILLLMSLIFNRILSKYQSKTPDLS